MPSPDPTVAKGRQRLWRRWVVMAAWVAALLAGGGLEAAAPQPEVSQYAHESWTLASGLPQNSVTSIVQTRDGHLWFGTREGLVRFNGAQFRVYDHSNLPGLAQNDIRSLAEGSGGELWMIAAGMGLACLRDGKVQSYTMADGLPDNNPNMICCDGSGRLWVATSHGLALATSPDLSAGARPGGAEGGQPATASFWLPELLQHRNISALSLDSMGTIWIGTADGDVYRAWGWRPGTGGAGGFRARKGHHRHPPRPRRLPVAGHLARRPGAVEGPGHPAGFDPGGDRHPARMGRRGVGGHPRRAAAGGWRRPPPLGPGPGRRPDPRPLPGPGRQPLGGHFRGRPAPVLPGPG